MQNLSSSISSKVRSLQSSMAVFAYRFVKCTFDIVFSAAIVIVSRWLFVTIAILIKIDDPHGSVFPGGIV